MSRDHQSHVMSKHSRRLTDSTSLAVRENLRYQNPTLPSPARSQTIVNICITALGYFNSRNTGVLMDFDALDNLDFGAAEEAIEELKKKQDEEAIVPGAGDNDCSSGACAI